MESVTQMSFVAGADLSSKRYYVVRETAANTVNVGSLSGRCVGVLVNEPTSGQAATVVTAGKVKAIAGATITAGQVVESTTTGTIQPKTADGFALGIANEAAASGAMCEILLMPGLENISVERLTAGADLTAKQYYCVKVGASANTVALGTLGAACVGILQNAPDLGEPAHVKVSGIASGLSGAAVTLGSQLVCDGTGRLINSDGTDDQYVLGIALNDTVGAGVAVNILLSQHGTYESIPSELRSSQTAGAAGTTAKTFVKAGTVAGTVDTAGAGEAGIGVSLDTDAGGGTVRVQMAGVASVTTGAVVAAGAALMCNASGQVITYVASADNHLVGYALSADGAGGADINVAIVPAGWEQDLPSQLTTAMVSEAGGVTAKQLVDAHTTDGQAVAISAAGQKAIGVSLTTDAGGGAIVVQTAGVATCTASTVVTAGDKVEATAAGEVLTASGVNGRHIVGIAISTTTGGAGEDISVLLLSMGPQAGTETYTIRSDAFGAVDTNWTTPEGGWLALPAAQTNEFALIHISGLPVGAVITAYRVLGALDSGGNVVTVDSKLRSLAKAAAATPNSTDEATAAQVSKTAAYALDDGASGLTVTVAADKTYHVWTNTTTAAGCTATISGVEIDYTL